MDENILSVYTLIPITLYTSKCIKYYVDKQIVGEWTTTKHMTTVPGIARFAYWDFIEQVRILYESLKQQNRNRWWLTWGASA
jgi:hypothetical protein